MANFPRLQYIRPIKTTYVDPKPIARVGPLRRISPDWQRVGPQHGSARGDFVKSQLFQDRDYMSPRAVPCRELVVLEGKEKSILESRICIRSLQAPAHSRILSVALASSKKTLDRISQQSRSDFPITVKLTPHYALIKTSLFLAFPTTLHQYILQTPAQTKRIEVVLTISH